MNDRKPPASAHRTLGEILGEALTSETEADAGFEDYRMEIWREASEDPLSQLRAAAWGDLDAQRALATAAGLLCEADGAPNAHVIVIEAVTLARLAAAQGEAEDVFRLVGLLQRAAQLWGPASEGELIGEAIAWLKRLAERGNFRSAQLLDHLRRGAGPEVVAFAEKFEVRFAKHDLPEAREDN